MNTEIKKVFYSEKDFEKDLVELIRQLANSNWRPDLILGPARGGLIPAVYLSHFYDVKMEPIELSLRDFKTDLQKVKINIDNILTYKNILVVDDIVDSGETLAMLKNILFQYLETECKNSNSYDACKSQHSVKFAALHYNISNEANFKPEYHVHTLNKEKENVWVDYWYESFWERIDPSLFL